MKTDPTANISIAIGIPLPQQSLALRQASVCKEIVAPQMEVIADTLETSDREGDGRLPYQFSGNVIDTDEASELDLLG